MSTAILGASGGCCRSLHTARDGTTRGQNKKKKREKKKPGSGPKDLTKESIVQISKASNNAFVSLDSFESFFSRNLFYAILSFHLAEEYVVQITPVS